jgi:hypothetical protein
MKHLSFFLLLIPALVLAQPNSTTFSQPSFRVGVQVGYGHRIAKIPFDIHSTVEDHLRKLKRNVSFGADMSYYFKNNVGIGIKYNGISASAFTPDMPYLLSDGSFFYDNYSNKIGIHLIGLLVGARFFLEHKNCLYANAGVGYVRYRDDAAAFLRYGEEYSSKFHFTYENLKMTGNAALFYAEVGYDFLFTKHLSIGWLLSASLGTLNTIYYTIGNVTVKEQLDKYERENLSHIDIYVVLRFYK